MHVHRIIVDTHLGSQLHETRRSDVSIAIRAGGLLLDSLKLQRAESCSSRRRNFFLHQQGHFCSRSLPVSSEQNGTEAQRTVGIWGFQIGAFQSLSMKKKPKFGTNFSSSQGASSFSFSFLLLELSPIKGEDRTRFASLHLLKGI